MTDPTQPQDTRHEMLTLALCNFLSKGWEVSILGMLAFLQQKYAFTIALVGVLSTVFIVSQITVSFFAGRIAHRIHSRNVVLLAITASGFSWLTLFLTHQVPMLYLAYAFGGVASGLFEPIGNSLVAKRSASSNRGTAIGNFAAYGDMGRIAVVAAATALAGFFGVNNACGVLFISTVVALLPAMRFLAPVAASEESSDAEPPIRLSDLLPNLKFRYATLCGIADSFSSASLYIFIPFLLESKGVALANTLYFNVIFFGGYMTGRLLLGRLADKHGAPRILMLSELLMAALIVMLTLANGVVLLLVLLYFLGVFTRGSSPIIRAMVADAMDDRVSFHDAFSAYSFASRGATAVCRPIYGYLASFAGIRAVFYTASAVSLMTLYPAVKYQGQESLAPSGVDIPADERDVETHAD